ncbi:MAG TPA: family 16 glycoside hydrolase, partial [Acidobacteriaceae bacterium]|nr:family 16 glycoside hydrolase [Acidobacteriaceae bacterium]
MFYKQWLLSTALTFVGATPMFASGPSFQPDVTFAGSSLAGWHTVGQASWRAEHGDLIATPQSGGGGWLMSNGSYQDIGLYANFRCSAGCEAGALFRAEKTADGWKGIYVALTEPDTPSYSITLDGQGKILTREKLRRGGGLIRVAPPPAPSGPPRRFNLPRYNVQLPFE